MKFWFFNGRHNRNGKLDSELESILGFSPKQTKIYETALRDRSAVKAQGLNQLDANERLEFLGDAILDAVVSTRLYLDFPKMDEGRLTTMRAKIVSRKQLNLLAKSIGLTTYIDQIFIGKEKRKSLYGDTLEALIGAIFLDQGFPKAKWFIENRLLQNGDVLVGLSKAIISHKSKVLEWAQKQKQDCAFKVTKAEGEQHNKAYEVDVIIDGKALGTGTGKTIKEAEEMAAKEFYLKAILA